jgi:hypothetical protein
MHPSLSSLLCRRQTCSCPWRQWPRRTRLRCLCLCQALHRCTRRHPNQCYCRMRARSCPRHLFYRLGRCTRGPGQPHRLPRPWHHRRSCPDRRLRRSDAGHLRRRCWSGPNPRSLPCPALDAQSPRSAKPSRVDGCGPIGVNGLKPKGAS